MRKINAVIYFDDTGKPVGPTKGAITKYMWFLLVNGQVMDDSGRVFSPSELTEYFHASSPDARKFRRALYPLTDMGNPELDYGSCRVFVEEWTCPVCNSHNRHVDDSPSPPASSVCRHCQTHLTDADIEEFSGVCQIEVDLNNMTTRPIKE